MTCWTVPSLATCASRSLKALAALVTAALTEPPMALAWMVSHVPPSMSRTLTLVAPASCAAYWLAIMGMVVAGAAAFA